MLVDGQSHTAIAAADAVLVASGTATLEVALFKKPMVIAYKVMRASWEIMRHMGYQPWIGLPNILAREFVVPELLQHAATPQAMADAVWQQLTRAGPPAAGAALHRHAPQPAAQQREESASAVMRVIEAYERGRNEQEEVQFLSRPAAPAAARSRLDIVCGVDEAGRGPLAGPVYAAAVILDPKRPIEGLRDSKKLTEARRDELAPQIRAHALAWAIAECSHEEIDTLNILQATMLAMRRAVEALATAADGRPDRRQPLPADGDPRPCRVEGDDKVHAISAASILAKTARDAALVACTSSIRSMLRPAQGLFDRAAPGAPAPARPVPVHRRSFAPVRAAAG
jgi:ribonuclease HII